MKLKLVWSYSDMKKKMKEPRKTSKKALMDEGSSYLPFNRLIEDTIDNSIQAILSIINEWINNISSLSLQFNQRLCFSLSRDFISKFF